ncbi:MAG: SCO1664 family protein [Acidimicrobiales bacterium]|jgi:hypothetical protein
MPEDERPPATGHLNGWSPAAGPDLGEALAELTAGELTIEGRLPWSSNLTFLVSVGDGGMQAVYKPLRGERPLWDFPGGLYRREVAAYVLSEVLGWGLVPPTVARDDGPFGEGSVQLFVEADFEQHYFTLVEEGRFGGTLRTVCAFDVVANNADRKSGHVLRGVDDRLWGIDHGLCFHPSPKLRTVIWDFAGDQIPGAVLADLEGLAGDLPDELGRLLSVPERQALLHRIAGLVRSGEFPEPGSDRPYPWPLV